MKLRVNHWGRKEELPVWEYTKQRLDGAVCEGGALEATARMADNIAEAFGRLLDVLAEKKHLTGPEIMEIVEGFVGQDVVELIE